MEAKAAAKAPVPRKKDTFSVAKKADKCIKDNFAMLVFTQTDTKLMDGLTLRQTLERDMEAYHLGLPDAPESMHQTYMARLRKDLHAWLRGEGCEGRTLSLS